MDRFRKTFPEYVKRRIACRQFWKCKKCDDLLTEAFQIDHTVPIWKGGADEEFNCSALCANCHAIKTQKEASERAAEKQKEKMRTTQMARERVLIEEQKQCKQILLGKGKSKCSACGAVSYIIFPHKCPVANYRAKQRFESSGFPLQMKKNNKKKMMSKLPSLLFEEFRYF